MHRIAGDIWPRRKRSSLTTLAFMLMCACHFANCEQQLVKHIHGFLQYNVCSGSTCPKPPPFDSQLTEKIKDFEQKHVLDGYRMHYNYTYSSISCELDTVRVNCHKINGIFDCSLPPNDFAYIIYGHVYAANVCTKMSYFRGNANPHTVPLNSSSATIGDLTLMVMTLKGTHDGLVNYFRVRCSVQGFNDSVQIVALVYRCC
ncbi:hypothetical protein DPMN_143846 [Dreissena polymorpha]|uniref:MD-2-related lipid-recognition domain-containing protein n=1 Tax=Dreissena polymorpha TaxID=45954 RepID=A0A9D4GH28_DREPO|nr:hypothetical protein DPMN_143846 [Dreissena polymorpha]